jgi:hypothetical protein
MPFGGNALDLGFMILNRSPFDGIDMAHSNKCAISPFGRLTLLWFLRRGRFPQMKMRG